MSEFTWKALYSDGPALLQVEADGTKNGYDSIDHDRLKAFQLWNGERPVLHLDVYPNERLIWRRRVETSPGVGNVVAHVVGKRLKTGEHRQEMVAACIFEDDGRVILSDKFDAKHPWLYPPQYMEGE